MKKIIFTFILALATVVAIAQTASSNSPVCGGGNLNLSASGGVSYQWSGPDGFTSNLQNPSVAFVTLAAAGDYTVTVTDSVGNSATAQTTVVINPAPVLSYTITNVSCSSNSDGAIDLSVSGCTPLSYAWSNGAVTEDLSGLPSGNYCVTVTCAGSCQANVCIMIIQPPPVPIITFPTVNLLCNGDSFNLCALAGNNPPYTYLWNTGDTAKCIYATAGTYSVTVTDSSGCTQTEGGTITQPASPLTAGIIKTDLKCYGVCTGMATGNAGGGTPPYSYQWSNGMTGDTLYNLCAWTYTCTVSDANACTASASVTITQPPYCPPIVLSVIDVRCYGECTGNIDIFDSCISSTNTYLWNNGSTTQDLYGVCAGFYSVTITDSVGCQRTAWTIINQPTEPLSDSIIVTNVSCHDSADGCIKLVVWGGTPPYSYVWFPTNDTSDVMCNMFLGTDSLKWIVHIIDSNGCTKTDSAKIYQPHEPLAVSATASPISGIEPLAVNFVFTGSGATTFLWDFGDGNTSTLQNPAHTYNKGTYTAVLTASAGSQFNCSDTVQFTINVLPSGIEDAQGLRGAIEIFPNPVNETLYINTELSIQQTEISDIIGRTILQTKSKIVPFSKYPAGVYLIRISTDRGEVVKKFVKE